MNTTIDKRAGQLKVWCAAQQPLQSGPFDFSMVSGDASFRRYFRVRSGKHSFIAVDAPPAHENSQQFCQVARFFEKHQVRVPEIFAFNEQHGFMLLEDLGDKQLLAQLNTNNADYYYGLALDALLQLQKINRKEFCVNDFPIPDYDANKLLQEMQLFQEWFLKKLLAMDLNHSEQQLIDDIQQAIVAAVLQQPKVCVHRDYHSRNLMLIGTAGKEHVAMIDFQDAVIGPISYDLVSLLKDCYIAWPAAQREAWLKGYFQRLQLLAVIDKSYSFQDFFTDFEIMGLQRHLKVLGIFARLNIRDHKTAYLKDLPLTFEYLEEALNHFPEQHPLSGSLHVFAEFFCGKVKQKFMQLDLNRLVIKK
jgi:N-acetylmuramate 1-kinase